MEADRPRVVVVGAGFGGLACARGLAGGPVDVTLIDRNNYHLFTPLLYQVASSLLNPSDIAYPVRTVFRRAGNVRFRLGEVTDVRVDERSVRLADGTSVPYDALVLASGSESTWFGLEGLASFSRGLKDLPEAMGLRNHILARFEAASRTTDPERRRRELTFAVVGGGPTGVEYAGALSELVRLVLLRDFPEVRAEEIRIVLVEALDGVFPMFREDLRGYAAEELRRKRIGLRLGERVVEGRPGELRLSSGAVLETETVVWAAGVKPSSLAEGIPASRSSSGRVRVGPDLSVDGLSGVYAIGDMASVADDDGELPMLAPPAMQQGAHVARVILDRARGRSPAPFRYRDRGIMATIGRKAAVAQVGRFGVRGRLGWIVWLILHLAFLIGFRNRLVVLVGWAWEYVRVDRPVRLLVRADE